MSYPFKIIFNNNEVHWRNYQTCFYQTYFYIAKVNIIIMQDITTTITEENDINAERIHITYNIVRLRY